MRHRERINVHFSSDFFSLDSSGLSGDPRLIPCEMRRLIHMLSATTRECEALIPDAMTCMTQFLYGMGPALREYLRHEDAVALHPTECSVPGTYFGLVEERQRW